MARWGGGVRGLTLVSVLVALAIIAILAVLLIGGIGKRGGKGSGQPKTTPGAAMSKARGVQCKSNLELLRSLILDKEVEEGHYPAALRDGGPGSVTRCPQTDKPYSYDPQTGKVWCTTPGHENW
jgi:hypothetical protein